VTVPAQPEPAGNEHASLVDNPEQRREVFGKLARRLQSLINRAIKRVDTLEREIEDPELLRGLYEIDHLATRVRRQAENLAVLGGEAPQRRSNSPVSAYAVLRSAVAEIEHYKQISIVAIEDVHLHGHAVAEIIHLLAELLENATTFTAPDAGKVVVRAQKVTAGLAVEVQDRGLGMTTEDLQRINRLLDGTTHIDIEELLEDGRIGMAVVRELAQRHGARVRLQTNIFGGIDAFVVLPHHLLAEPVKEKEQSAPAVAQTTAAPAVDTTLTPGQLSPVPAAPQPLPTRRPRPAESRPSPVPIERQVPAVPEYPTEYPSEYPAEYQTEYRAEHDYPAEAQSGPLASQEFAPLPKREAGSGFAQSSGRIEDPTSFGQLDQDNPPPLPQRRGQSHLRPELYEPVAPTRPIPGHNTNLMAAVQRGFDRGREEQQNKAAQSSQPQQGTTQGESVPHGR
ncbi:ATP-binding protein, partial [Amycolatopsis rhizosphaerae]